MTVASCASVKFPRINQATQTRAAVLAALVAVFGAVALPDVPRMPAACLLDLLPFVALCVPFWAVLVSFMVVLPLLLINLRYPQQLRGTRNRLRKSLLQEINSFYAPFCPFPLALGLLYPFAPFGASGGLWWLYIALAATRPRPVPRLIGCEALLCWTVSPPVVRCLTPAEGEEVYKCPACF